MDWFRSRIRQALLIASVAVLAACGGGGSNPQGTLRVSLTDAPNCRVGNDELAAVWVTVERVRVHQSSNAESNNSGWTDIAINPAKKINLLDLTNGRLEELGSATLPAGNYTQVRLVLSPNGGNMPANSIVLDGETAEIPMQTPSAAQSGLKIIRPFTVQPDTLVELVIDFDACRSVVARGNGSFGLKPVLTADLKTVAGIVGVVDPAVAGVVVSAQENGRVLRSTVPTSTGDFTLAYLDPTKTYDVVVSAPTRGTSVVAGVTVSTSAVTRLGTIPLPTPPAPPTPATRTASGTLGPVAARDTGVVRALQAVGATPVVEVATTNVDALSGSYSLTLPTAAPLRADFSTTPTPPLTFLVPASPSGTYTLEATAVGYAAQTNGIGLGTTAATWSPTLVLAP